MLRPMLRSMLRSMPGSMSKRALLVLVWLVMLAAGAGGAAATPRLALVDGADAARLHQALQISLQPWSFEVVDWPRPAAGAGEQDALDAAGIARNANARYVVWYDGAAAELVVHDAALGRDERRPLAALPADEAEASALALAIKTMLRLQEVPAGGEAEAGLGLSPWVRLGPRFGLDGDGGVQLRVQLGIEVVLAKLAGVRLGALGEVGTATEVSGGGGFSGEWSEWSAMGAVGKDVRLAEWTLTAQVAVGWSRGTLDGEDARGARRESSNQVSGLLMIGGGRAVGPFLLGGVAGLAARGAARHARENGQDLWQEPSLLLEVMAVARLEL